MTAAAGDEGPRRAVKKRVFFSQTNPNPYFSRVLGVTGSRFCHVGRRQKQNCEGRVLCRAGEVVDEN